MLHYGKDEKNELRFQGTLIDFGLVKPARHDLNYCFSLISDKTGEESHDAPLYLDAALNNPTTRDCIWRQYHKDEVIKFD